MGSDIKSYVDLVNNLFCLGKAIKDLRQGNKKPNLRQVFQDHIDPIYNQIEQIHKDYMDGLGGLLRNMREGELPPNELYEWLEQRRRALQSERIDAKNFGQELTLLNLDQSTFGAAKEVALKEFVKSITEYFYAPDTLYQNSFYSIFASQLKSNVQYPKRKPSKKLIKDFYETNFAKLFYENVEKAVDISLPRNWNRICVAHRTLKGLFLS